jgi:2-hydroxychromene-2-carboxylate isomerase
VSRPVFYFDFNSPYAYLAAARIDGVVEDADWRPIAFPILLHQLGRLEDVLQRDFPRVLAPLRAAVFAGERGLVREFTGAAFRKVFVESRSLAEADTLRDAAEEARLDPAEVAEAIQRADIKQRLKDNTDEALERGVTGIPTVAIGGDLFWGDDRLDEAAAAVRS